METIDKYSLLTVLFWNVKKNDTSELLKKITRVYDVDIIIIAEPPAEWEVKVKLTVNTDIRRQYSTPVLNTTNLIILSRLPDHWLCLMKDFNSHCSLWKVSLPIFMDLNIVVLHLPSRLHRDQASLTMLVPQYISVIRRMETDEGHSRTIVVGDFNMDPFEHGIVGTIGMHAVMNRKVAEKKGRVVDGQKYDLFYNPMWNFYGDNTPGPPGTYYYDKGDPISYFWNIYDQVLIRPDLMEFLHDKDVHILSSIGDVSLLNEKGVPDHNISDHLPLLFTLRQLKEDYHA